MGMKYKKCPICGDKKRFEETEERWVRDRAKWVKINNKWICSWCATHTHMAKE
jgi:rubredoxin